VRRRLFSAAIALLAATWCAANRDAAHATTATASAAMAIPRPTRGTAPRTPPAATTSPPAHATPVPPDEADALRTAIARGSVHALLDIGERRAQRGDLQGAAEPLRRALALAPNSERALAAYARTAIAARAPGSALLALEPLARMHPTVVDYSYLLGVAWMQIGDMTSALPPLERARALDPQRELTLAALGIGLTQLKRFADAKAVLDQALRLAPDDAETIAVLAEAEEGLGDHAAAEAHARRALAGIPGHPTALLVIGLVRMQEQRYAEARAAFEQALAARPDSAKTHYQLSLACARLADRECAQHQVELYNQALKAVEDRLAALRTQSLEGGEARP